MIGFKDSMGEPYEASWRTYVGYPGRYV